MVKELLLKSLIYLTKSYVCAKSLQSCPILCNPMDCGPTRLLCPFSRQEYWSGFAMSSLQGIFPTRDQTRISYVSCISRRVLYHSCHLVTWYTNSCSSLSCISHHPVSTMARARAHTWEVKSCCCSCRPSRKSQDRTVLSKPPVQSLVPSLEMSIQLAPSVWPWNCLIKQTRLNNDFLPELKVNTVVLLVLDSPGVCHLLVSADVQDQTNLLPSRRRGNGTCRFSFPFFMIQVLKKWNAVLGHHTGEVKYAPRAILTNLSGR